jgi:hypothetical protein
MSMTIEMIAMRVDTLEKQLALILKEKKSKKIKEEPSSDEEEVIVDKKKEKKDKKDKKEKKKDSSSEDEDKQKKKRGTNGYIMFSNANRDDVKAKLFVGDEKPKNTEIMKQLAVMWAEVSVEEKAEWTAKAKEMNESNVE